MVERHAETATGSVRRRHFEAHVIVLCVRWYLRYCLTLRDLEELMMERSLALDHSTIGRWVLGHGPELHKRIRREIRTPNGSWRVDETYVRVAGVWTYLYRAVDSAGETIDFMLSPQAGCGCRQALSSDGTVANRAGAPVRHQCGRERVLSAGHCGTEGERRAATQVPLSSQPLLEQHPGARPPLR